MAKRYKVLIGGKWVGDDWHRLDVINPYDDKVIGVVPETPPECVDTAIEAAKSGFAAMSTMPAYLFEPHRRPDYARQGRSCI